ncbi:hypothetical protein K2173_025126 [Erythroxylum novogranatense]|uniref:SUN domain-containing protein n=1 Tax=Erythroxylum novogranatense TaxID=1862640 RepID=A0AAV8SWY6_9ROSI|nr:hypothetical protein K2173_025126 [Erythroxylum novogranatense]
MSASTVSITAANTTTRRRPVVVGEKKPNKIELFPNEAQVNGGEANNTLNFTNDKGGTATSHSRDLSHHSIRGDVVLERNSKDAIQLKKNDSAVSPRRTRRSVSKPERPRWLTIMSILTKNLLLMLVLIGLVQMVRRMVLKSGDYPTQMGLSSELEGSIAEVESFLKTTTKMIQVQVEVVDKKIENEIGGLRREMSKKIDEKGAVLDSGLRKLEARSEELEKSIGELRAVQSLSKEEFEKAYQELVKGKDSNGGPNDVNLEEIMAYAKEVVEKEMEKHAADGLGRVDYALASGGATVVKHSEPFVPGKVNHWFSIYNHDVHPYSSKMLKPSFGEPGACFALEGSTGFVQIRLRAAIIPEAITLEHVSKSVAYDRSSAPKDCRVSGWLQGSNRNFKVEDDKMFLLREFTYDLEKSNAQTFDVFDSAASGIIDTVRLDFISNHGSPTHTCIYRLRVHGYEPDSVSVMTMQS